jgi:hypothetical protein
MKRYAPITAGLLLCLPALASAALCTIDSAPAATLLVPYFEVSNDCAAASPSLTTRLSFTNTAAIAKLTHVTVWSNAGVPVLDFDVYLQGYAQQEIDVRRLLCQGWLPRTGMGVSSPGSRAGGEINYPGCNNTSNPANGSPVYSEDGSIPAAELSSLRAALSGAPDPVGGQCSGFAEPDGRMTGYVTIDVVTGCNAPTPFAAGFDTMLDDDNVLFGQAVIEDGAQNSSIAFGAVPLEAASGTQLAGAVGFYGTGSSPREPLPVAWQVDRAPTSGANGNEMIVWRGSTVARSAFACGTTPPWYPLNHVNDDGYGSRGVFHVTDAGRAVLPTWRTPLPRATQRIDVATEFPEVAGAEGGYTFLNLQHDRQPGGAAGSQGWAAGINLVEGRFATLSVGRPVGGACSTAAFDNTSPGPDLSIP